VVNSGSTGLVVIAGQPRDWAAAPAAELVEAGIGGNPVRPRRELGAAVESVNAPDHGQESFLGGVSGVSVVARQAPAYRIDTVGMAPQEGIHGLSVPCLRGGNQSLVSSPIDHDGASVASGGDAFG
jgi:hypothetical protein